MNKLVEFLAHLDWFERADAFLRNLSGENSWRFSIPRDCGWSGIEIEKLLKSHGVKVWDRNFTRDSLTFRVRHRQANWAEYLLRCQGIPMLGSPFNPLNDEHARRYPPKPEPPIRRHQPEPCNDFLEDLLSLLR